MVSALNGMSIAMAEPSGQTDTNLVEPVGSDELNSWKRGFTPQAEIEKVPAQQTLAVPTVEVSVDLRSASAACRIHRILVWRLRALSQARNTSDCSAIV